MEYLTPSPGEETSLGRRFPLSPWLSVRGMDWSELTQGFRPETLPRGAVLYRQGTLSAEMFLIQEGRVQLECSSANGKKRAIYVVSAQVTMGEAGAMFGGVHDFQAVAVIPCQVYRIPAGEFRRRVEASPALAVQVLQVAARKGQILARLLTQDSLLGLPARLAQALLDLARQHGAPAAGGVLLTLRFTHQEMADLLGVSRVAVTQQLREFTRQGLLEKRGGLYLLPDPAALARCRDGRTAGPA